VSDAAGRRQIRAVYTDQTITVYQAFRDAIADAALTAGTFVSPFSHSRATWIKPSFLWMAYRCGWAAKEGQERVLAVEISREGFDWALEHACLSDYDRAVYPDAVQWRRRMKTTCVRVQWDPERDLHLQPLDHRAIQVGLTGEAVARYTNDWIVSIAEETARMKQVRTLLAAGDEGGARAILPVEMPYPVHPELAALIGATGNRPCSD